MPCDVGYMTKINDDRMEVNDLEHMLKFFEVSVCLTGQRRKEGRSEDDEWMSESRCVFHGE